MTCLLQLDTKATSTTKVSSDALTSTPYAHLIASALLSGLTKTIRTQACAVLKGLWLLESAKALHSNLSIARPAQHAQHAMLTLLLHWVPALPAYPEAAPLYLQLLTSILHITPSLGTQLETASTGSAKKKQSSSNQKTPPAKESKLKAADSSVSGSPVASSRDEVFSQKHVIQDQLPAIFAAVKMQSGVLADHIHSTAYRLLQVRVLVLCPVMHCYNRKNR